MAGYAWQVGRYDIGRTALEKIGGKYDSRALAITFNIPSRTASGTYALTSPIAQQLKDAESAAASGNIDAGITAYRAASEQIKPDDPASLWTRGRAQELAWQKQFAAGDWVDLTSQNNLDGWYSTFGDFKVDGDGIVGTTTKDGAQLICGTKFGLRWELRGNVEVQAAPPEAGTQIARGGPMFALASTERYYGILLETGGKSLLWHFDGIPDEIRPAARMVPKASYLIQFWDGGVKIDMNGYPYHPYSELWPVARRPDNRIAIGSNSRFPGAKFRVSSLQIRKLNEEPVNK